MISTLRYQSSDPGMVVLHNVCSSAFPISCAMVPCSGLTVAKSRKCIACYSNVINFGEISRFRCNLKTDMMSHNSTPSQTSVGPCTRRENRPTIEFAPIKNVLWRILLYDQATR